MKKWVWVVRDYVEVVATLIASGVWLPPKPRRPR